VKAKFSAPVQTGPEAHPASCTMGTRSFPGGKVWPGRDADPSPPSSAEAKTLLSLRAFVAYERAKPSMGYQMKFVCYLIKTKHSKNKTQRLSFPLRVVREDEARTFISLLQCRNINF